VGLDFSQGEAAANYRHSNSMDVQRQGNKVIGRTKFALLETCQTRWLIVYSPVTIRQVTVLAGCLYPVEH